jgi:regulator of sigma E protease
MIISFITTLLALFGLGFLIFIHELGHYFMAKKEKMNIEVFSIGLGKPFFSWMFQGVKWQLCYLPFGGYVKIAGEKDQTTEHGSDTFFGKTPWARLKVAIMGPLVNIVFALFLFGIIWFLGGKQEPFSKHTRLIGYVDPSSELYKKGVRPGDEILSYNGQPFNGFKDLLYASVMKQKTVAIEGKSINYLEGLQEPFHYVLTPYADPRGKGEMTTIGVLVPASPLVYQKPSVDSDFPYELSPIKESGIAFGDRVVWANGEMIFSMPQLNKIVNEPKTLLSVVRNGKSILVKVPRLHIGDLRLDRVQKSELEDWQHQIGSKGLLKQMYYIPYHITKEGVVKEPISYIGEDSEQHTVYDEQLEDLLKSGDKIRAVDGVEIKNGYQLFQTIQNKKILLIVQKSFSSEGFTWKNENDKLIHAINPKYLQQALGAIKGEHQGKVFGDIAVLSPIQPIRLSDLPLAEHKKNWLTQEYLAQKNRIEQIKDQQKRVEALKLLEKSKDKLVLGLPLSDVAVNYNPSPLTVFYDVIAETFKTLTALVTGKIHPKWMSGPVGMVQIMHHGFSLGIKEALFWMATISMNLGIFNLLPLPVLDGGHICFSLYEMITRKRVPPKVMEKLVIPFVVLLVGLFIYVTYQDVLRLFSNLF